MVTEYSPENAPGWAKHASSFKNDQRCYPIVFFTGTENEVYRAAKRYWQDNQPAIDYDWGFSFEGDSWVGVVVRDHV